MTGLLYSGLGDHAATVLIYYDPNFGQLLGVHGILLLFFFLFLPFLSCRRPLLLKFKHNSKRRM
jgi:hypothetical protein